MPTPRSKASRKYNAKAYDRIEIIVPKGKKAIIQAAAVAATDEGMSVNAFINAAIDEKMAKRSANAAR